ncbi:MAG TPA: GatB/YqeY domain-containing protein [Patescibacteria group bacterium]|nr:GatB/YqeY domain-containing protein [Patescibacteria group bacterium]
MLKDKIQQDILAALKAGSGKKVSILRLLLSEINNQTIAVKKELTDEEVIAIVRKEVKKLDEVRILFEKAERNDLAEANKEECEVLLAYLPKELSDEELTSEIRTMVEEHRDVLEQTPKRLMGMVIGKLKSRADTKRILSRLSLLYPSISS